MLAENIVEVWIEQFDSTAFWELERVLNPSELAQAERCRLPKVRQRKIFARARLRQILSHYLDQAPQAIEITLGTQGKPQTRGLEFNLSHSEDLAVYAISQKPVGIDVEYQRTMEIASLVQRFFAPSETAAWQGLPADQQQRAFFRAWTQKEAYMKAIGTGLYTPLEQVVVEMDLDRPCAIKAAPTPGVWQLAELAVPSNYVGVVVMAGAQNRVVTKRQSLQGSF